MAVTYGDIKAAGSSKDFWLAEMERRLLIPWEHYASNFLGFVQLACISTLLKQF